MAYIKYMLTRQSKNLKRFFYCAISLVIFFAILIDGCAKADDGNSRKSKSAGNNVNVVGDGKIAEAISETMVSVAEAWAPMRRGKKLFKEGKYLEARDEYLKSLKLHQEGRIDEWMPRWRLAEVYEKLDDRASAIDQLNWLIKDCQNEKTIEELKVRKQNLEKLLSGK